MNWKVIVGVSMLCITMMTGCEEKKTHSSESNETAKERVQVSKRDKEKEETVTEQGTPEDSSEEDTEEQKYKLQKIDISVKEQRRIEKRLTSVIEKCCGIYNGQTEGADIGLDGFIVEMRLTGTEHIGFHSIGREESINSFRIRYR